MMFKLFIAAIIVQAAAGMDIEDKLMTNGFAKGRTGGGPIDTVMLHFSSNVASNKNDPHNVDSVIQIFSSTNVSAHYLIDRQGKVYRLVNETNTSYHAGNGVWQKRTNSLNRFSIGVELLGIGSAQEMKKMIKLAQTDYDLIEKKHIGFTEAQYTSLKALLSDIRTRNAAVKNNREHIIGHQDYAPNRKYDPGVLFDWTKIGL